jgi:hypothetical protein
MAKLAHQRNRLQQPKHSSISLPLSLTDDITGMPSGAAIDRAATTPLVVLRHMRRHPQMTALLHKAERLEPFITAQRYRLNETVAGREVRRARALFMRGAGGAVLAVGEFEVFR